MKLTQRYNLNNKKNLNSLNLPILSKVITYTFLFFNMYLLYPLFIFYLLNLYRNFELNPINLYK